jgi:DNA-binding Lrp family transcriptional regulator
MTPTECDMRLIEGWQRGFPLVPRPYAAIGRELSMSETDVIERLRKLRMGGVLVRVGATVRPNTAGASTLAAMSVTADRIDEIAAIVSAEPNVTHNYEREHAFNLWFVISAADRASVDRILARIRDRTRQQVLALPLLRSYFVDLGFRVSAAAERWPSDRRLPVPPSADRGATEAQRRLLRAIEDGLPLTSLPYRQVARSLRLSQRSVLQQLQTLLGSGVVNRFGLIVRHRELGFTANAMAVWDVADDEVDAVGERAATVPSVTLCYRRRRHEPSWPYNLFCMVHGRDRVTTLRAIDEVAQRAGLGGRQHAVLFSTRCFKQRGATLARA